jgi:hypothetical protein
LYDLLGSGYKPHHKIKITAEVKADIAMWLQFNGHCFFPEKSWTSNIILPLFTNSSGNPELGYGAIFAATTKSRNVSLQVNALLFGRATSDTWPSILSL